MPIPKKPNGGKDALRKDQTLPQLSNAKEGKEKNEHQDGVPLITVQVIYLGRGQKERMNESAEAKTITSPAPSRPKKRK